MKNPYIILIASTLIAQLFLFAISPIIARIYNPEDVGAFGIILAIGAFLASLSTGRLELALPLVKNRNTSARVSILALIFIIFFTTLSFIVLLLLYFFDALEDRIWNSLHLFAIPFTCFSLALYNLANSSLVRREQFLKMGSVKVYHSFLTGICQLITPFFLNGAFGLILGQIFGYFASGIIGLKTVYKELLIVLLSRKLHLKGTLSDYCKYPFVLAPAAVFNQASQHIPVLAIGYFFGLYSAGLYIFVVKICNVPIALLGQTVSQVYSSKIRFYLNSSYNSISRRYIQLLVILICLGGVVISSLVACLYFWGVTFFGDKWENIGTVAILLSPMFFADFVSTPLSMTLSYLDKHKKQFNWDIFRFFSIIIFFLFVYKLKLSHAQALFGLSIVWLINATIHVYLSYQASNHHFMSLKNT